MLLLLRTWRKGQESNLQAPCGAHAFQACALPFGAPFPMRTSLKDTIPRNHCQRHHERRTILPSTPQLSSGFCNLRRNKIEKQIKKGKNNYQNYVAIATKNWQYFFLIFNQASSRAWEILPDELGHRPSQTPPHTTTPPDGHQLEGEVATRILTAAVTNAVIVEAESPVVQRMRVHAVLRSQGMQ